MRIILITGNERRHRYVAAQLAERIGLAAIISEAKAPTAAATIADPADPMVRHIAERGAVEAQLLGDAKFPDGVELLSLPTGAANHAATFDWVSARQPDAILLYGSSIIRAPLLEYFDGRIVNMHLGLSPYYRGAGTNFWALVDNCPEGVGATIHLATLKVDAGAILAQVRPRIEASDRAHHIGTRTIIAGVEVVAEAARRYLAGKIEPVGQDLSIGKVFRKKDWNAAAVLQLWHNLDAGMVPKYLADEKARRAAMPIVSL